jgi:hypothetical protein
MPESMTSAEWVVAGWGFASGVVLTLAVLLPRLWHWKGRCDLTSAGAGEQRLTWVRDRAAIRALRNAVATVARNGVLPPLVARPVPPRRERMQWAVLNKQVERPVSLADLEPGPEPVPDSDREVELDDDDRPRGTAEPAMWRERGARLNAAGASMVRRLARVFCGDRHEGWDKHLDELAAIRGPASHASDEIAEPTDHEALHAATVRLPDWEQVAA